MADRMSVLYDASKCTACQACSVACKQWNTLPGEKLPFYRSLQAHPAFDPSTYTFIAFREVRENNKMEWLFRKEQCMHCADAACQKACPQDAISHTEYGFVVINHTKCIGCGFCVTNCTFNVPRVNPKTQKSYKCTGCPERVANGMQPACVQTCQPEALAYGPRDKIIAMARSRFEQIKPVHPQAVLYDAQRLDGINFTYILLRPPEFYGLPADPAVPVSVDLWKKFVRPLGGVAIAGALLATAVGFIKTRGQANPHESSEPKDKGVGKDG
ncbi:MAG: 4Fe-4S dicluster domain-containing protein [Negativicutes bacterium]|nr:4Fe-4S dicluster domain-containing protein [Negativicutes bacterium]